MAPAAIWIPKEELSLIDFLLAHRAEAGNGANFKVVTFQKAAEHLAPLCERGAAKNAKSCGNKFCAFRKLYRVIRAIQLVSGWTWDNETGATIDIHTASLWDNYVKVHPKAKPFQNKGWLYFCKMEMLMPVTVAGTNVYHAASAPPLIATQPPAASLFDSEDESGGPSTEEQPNETSDIEEIPRPSGSGPKRKQEPTTPTQPSVKCPHASNGANALLSMAKSLRTFNTTLANVFAPPSASIAPTPICRTNTIATIL